MIFHPDVITMGKCYTMPFFEGLQRDGLIIINSDEVLPIKQADMDKLIELNAKLFYIPATTIASEIGGTELSTNMAMLGALLGITGLINNEHLEQALTERFSGGKFIASATTAALDDAVKSKFEKVNQLIEKNMDVVKTAASSTQEYKKS